METASTATKTHCAAKSCLRSANGGAHAACSPIAALLGGRANPARPKPVDRITRQQTLQVQSYKDGNAQGPQTQQHASSLSLASAWSKGLRSCLCMLCRSDSGTALADSQHAYLSDQSHVTNLCQPTCPHQACACKCPQQPLHRHGKGSKHTLGIRMRPHNLAHPAAPCSFDPFLTPARLIPHARSRPDALHRAGESAPARLAALWRLTHSDPDPCAFFHPARIVGTNPLTNSSCPHAQG